MRNPIIAKEKIKTKPSYKQNNDPKAEEEAKTQEKPESKKEPEKNTQESEIHKNTNNNKTNQNVISWSAREFIKPDRSPNWYIYAGISAIILILFAILIGGAIPAIVFMLIALVVYLLADKEPNKQEVKLTPKGIFVDNELYPYNELKSFWIFYDPPQKKELSLISTKIFMPAIKVQIEEENPVQIRRYLLRYLPEEEQEESIMEALSERLKF